MRLKVELSRRETEVAHLLAWGASKKEVADMLFISTRTVENTARNIYAKVGRQKATELCVWWFCTKHNVPVSLDPLKRTFVAVALLLIILPKELTGNGDFFRVGRRAQIKRREDAKAKTIITLLKFAVMTKIFKALGIEFTKPLKWYNWLTLAWVAVSFILLSIDTETAPIWAVFLVVANFALSIKVAAKTVPDIKDDENS